MKYDGQRHRTSTSGGSMRLLGSMPELPGVDLLAGRSRRGLEGLGLPTATPPSAWQPRLAAGDQLLWCLSENLVSTRVLHDDADGLVAWLAPGSEITTRERLDGRAQREMPAAERFSGQKRWLRSRWRGDGILRATRRGAPWSIWWFWLPDGRFNGWYVNLEVPHTREVVEGHTLTRTRDLLLDLWIDAGPDGAPARVWLKDYDELHAAEALGEFTSNEADAVWTIAQDLLDELVVGWQWPLNTGLEQWHPPTGWRQPLALPDITPVRDVVGMRTQRHS